MVFSDTTNKLGLIQDIDFLLFGSSAVQNTAYAIADRVRNLNSGWDEAVSELYKADPNFKWDDTTNSDFPLALVDLTANLDHYTLLDSMLVIHRVRVKDKNGDYKTLTAKNRAEFTDAELKATGEPDSYYKMGGAIFPVPIPDYGATDGVEIEFQRGGNYFAAADTTKTPGFNAQFHRFLSLSAALDYAVAAGLQKKISNLTALKEAMRVRMVQHYERRSPDAKPKISLKKGNVNRYGL
jgi:hypothetical protein